MASLRLLFVCGILAVAVAGAGAAHAQSATPGGMPPPPGMSLTQSAAMRFPQPVRVGGLLGREVLRPVESQDVLGWVRRVVRDAIEPASDMAISQLFPARALANESGLGGNAPQQIRSRIARHSFGERWPPIIPWSSKSR